MRRRTFLTTLPALVAGCAGAGDGTPTRTATPGASLAEQGIPSDICAEEIQPDPGIPAIVEPAFAEDWRGVDPAPEYLVGDATGLVADQTVVGLAGGDRARAYPVEVLWHHEIVNDRTRVADRGERPVLVTFCPLCNSGVVADRTIRGEPTVFAVSGLLWKPPRLQQAASARANRTFGAEQTDGEGALTHAGNLVMYDRATRSYWSRVLAQAICGPLRGQRLSILPSTVTTWGEWRTDHPETDVLLPPPQSKTVGE